MDAYFDVPVAVRRPARVRTSTRDGAPFALDGDPRARWPPKRRASRAGGVLRADDETWDAWAAVTPADVGRRDAATLEAYEAAKTAPPFWTEGAAEDARFLAGRRHCGENWAKCRGDSAARPYYADAPGGDEAAAAVAPPPPPREGGAVPALVDRMRRACAADARLAESALNQFRTGGASVSRGEVLALAQHLGCGRLAQADVDVAARWVERGGALAGASYDVDGAFLATRETALRELLGLPGVSRLGEADAAAEAAARSRRRPDGLSDRQRRTCYRCMRRARAIADGCAAADPEGRGSVTGDALDAVLRDGSLVPEHGDRHDVLHALLGRDGRCEYGAIYATLERFLAADRGGEEEDPSLFPRRSAPSPHPRGSQEARGDMASRRTQDHLARVAEPRGATRGEARGEDAPALSGWRGSDGCPRVKGRSDEGVRAKALDDLQGSHVGSGVTKCRGRDGDFDDLARLARKPVADDAEALLEWGGPPTPARPDRRPPVPELYADETARVAGVAEVREDDLDDLERRLERRRRAADDLCPSDARRRSLALALSSSRALAGSRATATVRLRHAFRRHGKRGASAGGGALLLVGARGAAGAGPGERVAATDVDQVLKELGVDLTPPELAVLVADARANAVAIQPAGDAVDVDALVNHAAAVATGFVES